MLLSTRLENSSSCTYIAARPRSALSDCYNIVGAKCIHSPRLNLCKGTPCPTLIDMQSCHNDPHFASYRARDTRGTPLLRQMNSKKWLHPEITSSLPLRCAADLISRNLPRIIPSNFFIGTEPVEAKRCCRDNIKTFETCVSFETHIFQRNTSFLPLSYEGANDNCARKSFRTFATRRFIFTRSLPQIWHWNVL